MVRYARCKGLHLIARTLQSYGTLSSLARSSRTGTLVNPGSLPSFGTLPERWLAPRCLGPLIRYGSFEPNGTLDFPDSFNRLGTLYWDDSFPLLGTLF